MTTSADRSSSHYSRGVRKVLIITLLLNLTVVAIKLVIGILAQSLSIISDALHRCLICDPPDSDRRPLPRFPDNPAMISQTSLITCP